MEEFDISDTFWQCVDDCVFLCERDFRNVLHEQLLRPQRVLLRDCKVWKHIHRDLCSRVSPRYYVFGSILGTVYSVYEMLTTYANAEKARSAHRKEEAALKVDQKLEVKLEASLAECRHRVEKLERVLERTCLAM